MTYERFKPLRRLGITLLAVSLVAACGSSGENKKASGGGDAVEYSFAMGSSGAAGAFYQGAMERSNTKYGYKGKWVELSGSEVAVSGIASNKFQFGAGVAATVMAAQQEQSAPLTFIGDYMRMFWTLVGKNDIKTCEDLDGVRFGLHSPGGVSTAIFKSWFAKTCPASVKPKIVYVEGSPNRFQGLMAKQLDATMLEVDDTLDLPADRFHIMVNFSKDLPEIEANTVYSNDTFLKEHPDVAVNLLKEMSALAKEVKADPSVMSGLIKKYKPELAKRADEIAKAYVDGNLFAEDGSMSMEDLTKTINLYETAGAVKPGLKAEEIADRQYLEKANAGG
jgi:ABC-type nitrate/sulfonate/bicarbonate transport system substrate-binding protein